MKLQHLSVQLAHLQLMNELQRIVRVSNNIQITVTATFFEGSVRTSC